MTAPLRLGMVAGEASGDLLASLLMRELRERWPDLHCHGIGGPRMVEQGFEAWWPSERLAVFGYVDALARLPELLRIRRQLAYRLMANLPQAFIGVDAPDFNFWLETELRGRGVKTIHFVCPSIWAWRGERVRRLGMAADHVLCLFPFEPALLHSAGIAATFVGHPLADVIAMRPSRSAARAALGLDPSTTLVAILPGSRSSEIDHIGPPMLAAAALMHQRRPDLCFVLPLAPGARQRIEPMLARHAGNARIKLVDGRSHEALAACNVAMVASGTATLEAALFKRPMVVVYRMAWLNWQRMKRMSYQPWFGLPNVLAREFIVPELIQDAATPEALARETAAWLDDQPRIDQAVRRFEAMHHELRQGTAKRATHAIAQIIEA